MGELRDAIDMLVDLKDEMSQGGIYITKRSISASAMDGTANFPVLVDDSMSLDDSLLISKAAEKKFASFLLTVLTMDPYLTVTRSETPSAARYLHQFHQNMRVKSPDKGVHLSLVDFVQDSTMEYETFEGELFRVASAIYEGVKQSIPQNINAKFNYTIQEVTTPDSLNDRFKARKIPMLEGTGNGGNRPPVTNYNSGAASGHRNTGPVEYSWIDGDIDRSTNSHNTNTNSNNRTINNTYETNRITNNPKQNVREKGNQWKTLTDNDCKKANDLVPTLLHVRVYPIDKYTREELTPIDFIIGVKATLHPIPSDEIARMTVAGMRNENTIFNFIRWTTGEIKFFKDFLFAIDTAKMDAKDAGGDVTGWRPALKKRRLLSKSKIRLTPASLLPNATLVISQPTIENIAEIYGYKLDDPMIINRMMDVYFLLSYIIVNPVLQRVTFRFDGIKTTDTYTYDTLRRESQTDDKAFKNMMKMLGRSM